jgi:hypothetical protein
MFAFNFKLRPSTRVQRMMADMGEQGPATQEL